MSEESSEKYVILMLDIPNDYILKNKKNKNQKITVIDIWKKGSDLSKIHDVELKINNGVVQIPVKFFEENKLRFKLASKNIYGNILFNIEIDPSKALYYYMGFEKNDKGIQVIKFDEKNIKGFKSEEELNAFKQKQHDEPTPEQPTAQNEQPTAPEQPPEQPQTEQQTEQPVEPPAEPAPEQPPEQPQTEQQTEQPVEPPAEPAPEQPPEQPVATVSQSESTGQPVEPAAAEQQPEATDSNDSNQEKDANSQKTNNKSSKSKWIFMLTGGLLVAAGIAMSFLTFGFGVIPFGTTMAALSVAIPSVLGTALVTGASTQFAKRKMSKIAIAAIALGAALTLSTILLSVFTFGLGAAALGAITAGFAIGIPAAIGVGAITVGSIIYDGQKKKYGGFEKLSELSENSNDEQNRFYSTATTTVSQNGNGQPTQGTKVPDLTTNDGENVQTGQIVS